MTDTNSTNVKFGDIITIDYKPPPPDGTLERTVSTYSYPLLITRPYNNETKYTICDGDAIKGFHLVKTDSLETAIGFCLLYVDDEPYIKVTQFGFEPEQVSITIVGYDDNAPKVGSHVGSVITFCPLSEVNERKRQLKMSSSI
jgi:hypothetical protein